MRALRRHREEITWGLLSLACCVLVLYVTKAALAGAVYAAVNAGKAQKK